MNDERKGGGGYLSGFMTGALIGAAAVFFFGTKKGQRMAKLMQKKGGRTFKDLEKLVADIEQKGKTFAEEAKEVTAELKAQVKSGKKEVQSIAKKQLSHIKKLQDKGRAAAAHYFKTGEIHPDKSG